MENEKSNLYVVAIVAIIAIVGVIVLITSGSKTGTITSEDAAGQATRVTAVDTTKIINANSCNADSTCEMDIGSANTLTSMMAAFGTQNANGSWSIALAPETAGFNVITNFYKFVTFNAATTFNKNINVNGIITGNELQVSRDVSS